MKYAVEIVPFGDFGNPRVVVDLAETAEANGWQGLFVWDHLAFVWGIPGGDPWIILAAVAARTQSLTLGTSIAPLPRYQPHLLAHALVSLDILSNGRTVFGTGLGGVAEEFSAIGQPDEAKVRAAMLDEGLQLLDALLSGKPVQHQGAHYVANGITLAPLPVQEPRMPIWIGGESRPALRRAAAWDGWIIGAADMDGQMIKTPQQLAEQVSIIREYRSLPESFSVAVSGVSGLGERALVGEYADAGATWWLESVYGMRGSVKEMKARIAAGPPS